LQCFLVDKCASAKSVGVESRLQFCLNRQICPGTNGRPVCHKGICEGIFKMHILKAEAAENAGFPGMIIGMGQQGRPLVRTGTFEDGTEKNGTRLVFQA